jgi:uncharacterized protein YciI
MKHTALLCVFLLLYASSNAQNSGFDKRLADSLGADKYGMKKYTLVMLRSGTDTTVSKSSRDSLFAGHMQNIGRLVKEGKLIVAGPLGKNNKAYRGIFILNVSAQEEAEKLLQTDPAIAAKLLIPEIFSWYGSAALPLYLPYHDRLQEKGF